MRYVPGSTPSHSKHTHSQRCAPAMATVAAVHTYIHNVHVPTKPYLSVQWACPPHTTSPYPPTTTDWVVVDDGGWAGGWWWMAMAMVLAAPLSFHFRHELYLGSVRCVLNGKMEITYFVRMPKCNNFSRLTLLFCPGAAAASSSLLFLRFFFAVFFFYLNTVTQWNF